MRLGFFVMNFGNIGVGLIISLVSSWPITLVILAFVPLIIISGAFQSKLLNGFSGKDKEAIEQAGIVISSIDCILWLK